MRETLRKLGVEAQPLESDVGLEYGRETHGWVELADGPIRRVSWSPCPVNEGGRTYCYVPDPRLHEDVELDVVHVSTKRIRRIPLIGATVGTGWRWFWDPSDFSDYVIERFNRDTAVLELITTLKLDIQVIWFFDEEWEIGVTNLPATSWNPSTLKCINAVATALLAMPLPEHD